ncbi:cytochrome c [Paraflavisolibacter sp. H34]|uniref:c-type cytochrome n=1 Tax=Huijunlia imazamoxiresistens TaxID=3127457 RepID=UPI003018586E
MRTGSAVVLAALVACTDSPPRKAALPAPPTVPQANVSTYSYQTPEGCEGWPGQFGFGRRAHADKVAAIDIDVRPDGKGLPSGRGTVAEGRQVYQLKCAPCHGVNGVDGPYNHLVYTDTSDAKAIGNYWPYATTLFDYIRRAMPFTAPGSLTNAEVYNVTAYLLHANKLIDSTDVLDARTLPLVAMPARKLFVPDDRKGGPEIR